MNRTIALLAILASSVFFVSAINAAPASAANCTPSAGNSANVAGAVRGVVQLSSCTGITAIRFLAGPIPNPYVDFSLNSGWYESSPGWEASHPYNGYMWAYLCGVGCTSDVTINTTIGGWTYIIQPCWGAHGTHALNEHFWYQIKNAASPFNWGPAHEFLRTGSPNYVAC